VTELEKSQKLSEIEAIRSHDLDETAALERLRALLADEAAEVRSEAASAVWEHAHQPELVEKALDLSTKDPAPEVRIKATTALGRVIYEGDIAGADEAGYRPDPLLGEPPAEQFRRVKDHLFAITADEKRSLDERRFALEGLGFLGHDAKVRELVESFWKKGEPKARLSAVFAMGRSGDARWAASIQEAMGSDDDELRLQAVWAAGEAEVQAAGDALARLAREAKKREERLAATESLARLGGEKSAKVLLELAENDRDPEVRDAAAQGLEEIALLDSSEDGGLDDDEA
jgi:HEAT repeat protein